MTIQDFNAMFECANNIIGIDSFPPIADAFDAKMVSIPRDTWLDAKALACFVKQLEKDNALGTEFDVRIQGA